MATERIFEIKDVPKLLDRVFVCFLQQAGIGMEHQVIHHGAAVEILLIELNGSPGIFFEEQTPQCLINAVRAFDPDVFQSTKIRQHALKNYTK